MNPLDRMFVTLALGFGDFFCFMSASAAYGSSRLDSPVMDVFMMPQPRVQAVLLRALTVKK